MRRESLMMTWIRMAHCNDGRKINIYITYMYVCIYRLTDSDSVQ